MDAAIETVGLTKVFHRTAVLNQVNLSIPQGTIYGIVGANGAGKSTLLSLLQGVMWPTAGEIKLYGTPLPPESAEMRQRIGHVATEGRMYSSFRVEDLVRFAGGIYHRWDAERCERLLLALELPRRKFIKHLSFGMRMQLRLAVRLSAHPDVLLLDEPTNGLDAVVKRQFLQLIIDEAIHDGTTIIMATHQLADLERMADGIAVMYQGRVIADGLIDDLKAQIHSYQAVLQDGLPASVTDTGRVLHTEQRGSVWTVVADDGKGEIGELLRQHGSYVELIPLDLEDVFSYLLLKEGYSRDAILLA